MFVELLEGFGKGFPKIKLEKLEPKELLEVGPILIK